MTRPLSEMTRAELVDEVVRLQQRNADLAVNEHLQGLAILLDLAREHAKRLEQERDALAAHLERLREGHERAFSTLRWSWLRDLLDETPETSLARLKAQWQAEALESMAKTPFAIDPSEILAVAAEFRRQAEGGGA